MKCRQGSVKCEKVTVVLVRVILISAPLRHLAPQHAGD